MLKLQIAQHINFQNERHHAHGERNVDASIFLDLLSSADLLVPVNINVTPFIASVLLPLKTVTYSRSMFSYRVRLKFEYV